MQSAVDGFNVTIFCYGQTGAGKTFTMYGVPEDEEMRGVAPRAIHEIFRLTQEREARYECTVYVQMVELYRNAIIDLLYQPEKPPPGRCCVDVCCEFVHQTAVCST